MSVSLFHLLGKFGLACNKLVYVLFKFAAHFRQIVSTFSEVSKKKFDITPELPYNAT